MLRTQKNAKYFFLGSLNFAVCDMLFPKQVEHGASLEDLQAAGKDKKAFVAQVKSFIKCHNSEICSLHEK